MKLKQIFGLAVLGLIFGATACVPNKKYNEATAQLAAAQERNRALREDFANIKERLELMESANSSAASEIDEKNQSLLEQKKQIDLKSQLLTEQQERLKHLQAVLEKQKEQSALLRNKMSEALKGFGADQLTVTQKDGKVYVSMQEKLLFPSGSAVINSEGKSALEQLAAVLNQNADININVEGHTDSIPIKVRFEDNWALSTARANAIVRILTQEYGVDPIRVIASGRSEFLPINSNETADGRAKNRRTEIILEPKLNALMEMLQQD